MLKFIMVAVYEGNLEEIVIKDTEQEILNEIKKYFYEPTTFNSLAEFYRGEGYEDIDTEIYIRILDTDTWEVHTYNMPSRRL